MASLGALILLGVLITAVVDHFFMGNRPKGTINAIGFPGILLNNVGVPRNRRWR
jgi:hypothetical protein